MYIYYLFDFCIFLQDDNLPVWVDTVGWDDAECEDDETFKDILRFIDKYSITKVKDNADFNQIILKILPLYPIIGSRK